MLNRSWQFELHNTWREIPHLCVHVLFFIYFSKPQWHQQFKQWAKLSIKWIWYKGESSSIIMINLVCTKSCLFFQKDSICKVSGTFLIVSPGSVMYNWKEELETWGHFKMGLFHGNTKEDTLQRTLRGRLDVALTTYETMRNHLVSSLLRCHKTWEKITSIAIACICHALSGRKINFFSR